MRVLVTGGAGFIGSHIVEAFVAAGDDVVVLDVLLPSVHGTARQSRRQTASKPSTVTSVTGPTIDRALRGVDVVCHQAAMVGLGKDIADLPDYVSAQRSGHRGASRRDGIGRRPQSRLGVVDGRLRRRPLPLQVSTESFEPRHAKPPISQPDYSNRDALDAASRSPGACRRRRRVRSPKRLRRNENRAGVPRIVVGARNLVMRVCALRYHNVYGPRMPRDTPYAGVAALFRSELAAGRPPRVFEDGGQLRDFVHVTDVARANVLATRGERREFRCLQHREWYAVHDRRRRDGSGIGGRRPTADRYRGVPARRRQTHRRRPRREPATSSASLPRLGGPKASGSSPPNPCAHPP